MIIKQTSKPLYISVRNRNFVSEVRRSELTNMAKHKFTVIIEKDEDGIYIASVPALPGCHTQAKDLNELEDRIKEAIVLYLEVEENEEGSGTSFVGVREVEVAI